MPFCRQTIDFLVENRLRDSKEWFSEHKYEYDTYVKAPITELFVKLSPMMRDIDDKIVTDPRRCISRIHRDTRFAKDKSLYRDNLWFTFSRNKNAYGIYFAMWPGGFSYGCGYYEPDKAVMNRVHQLILSGDKDFKAVLTALKKHDIYKLNGEKYKRSRHPDAPEDLREWLDRKSFYIEHEVNDEVLLFSDDLADKLIVDYKTAIPLYRFILKAEAGIV